MFHYLLSKSAITRLQVAIICSVIVIAGAIGGYYWITKERENVSSLLWKYRIDDPAVSVAVSEDVVVVGSKDLYALDLNGNLMWKHEMKQNHSGWLDSVAIVGDTIIAGDDHVYAFDLHGNHLWTYEVGVDLGAVVAGEEKIVGGKSIYVFAIGMNGSLLWKYWKSLSTIPSIAIGNNMVIVGSLHYGIHALDLNGELLWKYDISGISSVAVGEIVVVGSPDNGIHALDLDGELLWEYGAEGIIPVAIDSGITVAGGYDGVLAFDLNGALLWNASIRDLDLLTTTTASYSIALSHNKTVVGTNRHVYAFDLNGNQLLRYKTGRTEVALAEDMLIAGSWDGYVYAFSV